ncbi:MAG TPA: DsrE family protein [Acidimicrobiia bacterium]|nr:DsrE family protein [Acidimicrobiia bacterium]
MGSLLVHVTHGPEAPTRAALACLVAVSAVEAGHEVKMFFAGDAAYLLKDEVIESTRGIGTGALSDHLPKLVEAGISIHVSGMSSKSRGVTEADLAGKNATFATPATLVELAFAADRVLTY